MFDFTDPFDNGLIGLTDLNIQYLKEIPCQLSYEDLINMINMWIKIYFIQFENLSNDNKNIIINTLNSLLSYLETIRIQQYYCNLHAKYNGCNYISNYSYMFPFIKISGENDKLIFTNTDIIKYGVSDSHAIYQLIQDTFLTTKTWERSYCIDNLYNYIKFLNFQGMNDLYRVIKNPQFRFYVPLEVIAIINGPIICNLFANPILQ